MLNWANRFNIFCFLDNSEYTSNQPSFECMLAAGVKENIQAKPGSLFQNLSTFYTRNKGSWIFGHVGYDVKNETEELSSGLPDGVGFNDLYFFIPEFVLHLDKHCLIVYTEGDASEVYNQILLCGKTIVPQVPARVMLQQRIEKRDYIQIIEKLKQHIHRGDCYVINFCQEYFSNEAVIDPFFIYSRLRELSPNPFSAFYRLNDRYCLCASPERYLKKKGSRIFSQPIKGTAKRVPGNVKADEASKNALGQNEKEKSENVMIVDLVRNDLSRICKPGSVKVDELFGLYSFPQVYQMISTVSGELIDGITWVDCLQKTFPMASMTGAPKKRVMELIERYEKTRRGLFSGTIGYAEPNGDCNFNVVIRSMMYNETTKYLSFQTGGGITGNSHAELEYDECMLKATAMLQVLK